MRIDAVVFDVLGTLVDEPSGLAAAFRTEVPGLDEGSVDGAIRVWQEYVANAQDSMRRGERPFAGSDTLDREAAQRVVETLGLDHTAAAGLASAGWRLPPWPDSVAGLERIARSRPILGLSNAARTSLLRLNAHAGLRFHQALSAETVGAYKPDPAVYRLALDVAGVPPERMLMVAAHAWDLRGAQAVGMRTAYVHRPIGDPPSPSDSFDHQVAGLEELAEILEAQ